MLKNYKVQAPPSVGPGTSDRVPFDRERKVQLAIENMSILDFIDFFFGKLMGVSYTLHPPMRTMGGNKININLQQELTLGQLYPVVLSLLQECGVVVSFRDGVFRVFPKAAQQANPPYVRWGMGDDGDTDTSSVVIQIIPVRYLGEKVKDVITLIQGAQQKLRVKVTHIKDPDLLMVIGGEQDVRAAVKMIGLLDRPFFSERHIAMLRLEYWTPEDFMEKLGEVLRAEGIVVSDEIQTGGLSIIPMGRLRAVLCFSPELDWLQRVRYWKKILDVPSRSKGEEGFFVYFPNHARAEELGKVLSEILALVGGKAVKKEKPPERAPDIATREATPKGGQQEQTRTGGRKTGVGAKGAVVKSSTAFARLAEKGEGALNVALVVDDVRNALIVYCSPNDYNTLKNLLEQIDIMPKQVLIEVTIAEVTLKDDLQYGVEWYLKNSGNITGTLGTLGGLALPAGGLTYSLISSSQKFQAMLTMLAKKTDIRILSTPHVMVRDNESANIKIGQDVPVLVSATTSDIQQEGSTQIIQSVEYRATGVMLSVTPTINSREMVTLEISQEMSEAQTNPTSNLDSPLILDRSIQTTVVSKHGQSILLGGIISDTLSEGENKVPFLGDIPILGYLFKTKTKSRVRSEVIMLVTPRIIHNEEDIDAVRREILGRMNLLDEGQTGRYAK